MLREHAPQKKENAKPDRPRKPSGFAYGFGPVSSKWWKFIEVTEITAPGFALYLAVLVCFQNLERRRPQKKNIAKPDRPRKPSGFAYGFGPVSSKWWKFIEVTEIPSPQFALYLAVFVWFQNLEWTRPPKKKNIAKPGRPRKPSGFAYGFGPVSVEVVKKSSKWRKSQRRNLPCT